CAAGRAQRIGAVRAARRSDHPAAARARLAGAGGADTADVRRRRGNLLRELPRHGRRRRRHARFSGVHADGDDVERRHRRRRVVGDCPRGRRRPPSRRRGAGAARRRHRRAFRRALHARRLGGRAAALGNATLYANVLFLSAVPGWVANLLAAALRGVGNVRVPAIVTAGGALLTLALSPLFIFGWGPVPSMGVGGAALAVTCFNVGSLIALVLYMRSARSPIRLAPAKLEWRLFKDILRVGLLSAVGTVLANLTVIVTTGLVGAYSVDAIAGYGLASRLDYL